MAGTWAAGEVKKHGFSGAHCDFNFSNLKYCCSLTYNAMHSWLLILSVAMIQLVSCTFG